MVSFANFNADIYIFQDSQIIFLLCADIFIIVSDKYKILQMFCYLTWRLNFQKI